MTASVAVSQLGNGVLNYHNAGKVQARVLCSGPAVNWSSNGNLMKIVYDAP